MHHEVYVAGPHFDEWFKQNPKKHRTDHRGHRIICPHVKSNGYPARELDHRPTQTHACPSCGEPLGKANPIGRHDQKEFCWELPDPS
jgi:hypothetical protein